MKYLKPPMLSMNFSENKIGMKKRISNVLNNGKKHNGKFGLCMVVLCSVIVGFFVGCSPKENVIKNNEDKEIFIEEATETIVPVVESRTFTVKTVNGYFKTDKEVKVIKHIDSEVIFELPFGINRVKVTTLSGNNQQKIEKEYEVE